MHRLVRTMLVAKLFQICFHFRRMVPFLSKPARKRDSTFSRHLVDWQGKKIKTKLNNSWISVQYFRLFKSKLMIIYIDSTQSMIWSFALWIGYKLCLLITPSVIMFPNYFFFFFQGATETRGWQRQQGIYSWVERWHHLPPNEEKVLHCLRWYRNNVIFKFHDGHFDFDCSSIWCNTPIRFIAIVHAHPYQCWRQSRHLHQTQLLDQHSNRSHGKA